MPARFLFTLIALIILLGTNLNVAFSQVRISQDTGKSKPFILGITEEVDSRILSERRILNIYLPNGYYDKATARYPVIYLLDGGKDEDFIHIVGLVQFNSFPWIDRLPNSIVVGIANTDRQRDFTFPTSIASEKKNYPTTGGSANFISFLEKELQPFIERNFRTQNAKTIIGESLGGLLATEILIKRPGLFNRYILVSPSLWWDNGSLLDLIPGKMAPGPAQISDIYIGVGKEGLTPGPTPRVMEADAKKLADKLRASKRLNAHVYFDFLPSETHATVMHQAVFNAFRLIYPQPVQAGN
ncbi:MAG TPA: alpha/beta hydrolase-fold protein [Puia sp.]|nr:alpha/beta hydrolase-fold protein [Puia sp.]